MFFALPVTPQASPTNPASNVGEDPSQPNGLNAELDEITFIGIGPMPNSGFSGFRASGAGQVGCSLNTMLEAKAMALECPGFASAEEFDRLNARLLRVANFYTEYLRPARSQDEVLSLFSQSLGAIRLELQPRKANLCNYLKTVDPLWYDEIFLGAPFDTELQQILARPFFPYNSRCIFE